MTTRKNNSLTLQAIEGNLIPEEQTYQARLRMAIFDGVKECDVKEIVEGLVNRAKAGDAKAAQLVFDYVLGTKNKPTAINVTNNFANVEQAAELRKGRSA